MSTYTAFRCPNDLLKKAKMEVELLDGQKELAQLKREIALAAPIIHAIMRSDDLVALLPDEIGQEFVRFCEVY